MANLPHFTIAGSSDTRLDYVVSDHPTRLPGVWRTGGPALFVIGADRSGTTLLRLILNRHPKLAIPPESHFLVQLLATLPLRSKLAADQVQHAANVITQCPSFSTWCTTTQDVEAAFRRQTEPTLATLVDAVFRLEIAASGKPLWGDKTPAYTVLVESLHELYPQARFVQIVRDGRDVSISLRNQQWRGWTEYQRARYWSGVVQAAEIAGQRIGPEQYMRIAYEDLVLSCESTVRNVCDFLCIEFDHAMLMFYEDAMQHIPHYAQRAGIHQKLVRPPQSTDVERWRQESSAIRVWLFEAIAGGTLEQVGIARKCQGAPRCLGAIIAVPYRAIGGSIDFIQRLFERLPVSFQDRLRQNKLLRKLKQVGCRC